MPWTSTYGAVVGFALDSALGHAKRSDAYTPSIMNTFWMLPAAAVATGLVASTLDDDTPREFGAVDWGRKLEPALERSASSGKPVLLFFQEVPG